MPFMVTILAYTYYEVLQCPVVASGAAAVVIGSVRIAFTAVLISP